MAGLRLSFLGPFQAFKGGKLINGFDSNKTRALLAYLAVETGRPHSREALAGLIWPDRPHVSAMNSLRSALANLRKTIGDSQAVPPFLLINHPLIQFNGESDCWVDVWEFEKYSAVGIQQSAFSYQLSAVHGPRSAFDLYRGEFLEGFSLSGSPEFEEWILVKRQHYQDIALKLLQTLAEQASQEGEYEQALGYARRTLELEPWEEHAHQQAIFLLALLGQRSAALAQYQACRKVLEEELGVEPADETTQIFEQICSGEIVSPPGLVFSSGEARRTSGPLFVARQAELQQMEEALRKALMGKGQLLFVSGGPGSGKTALATEFIHRALLAHPGMAAATGKCQAYFGQGDPYLPFREVLEMLIGREDERYEAGMTGQETALRLWRSSGLAIQTLVEEGPALVETFLPGASLLELANRAVRWKAYSQGKPGWLARLEEIVRYRQQLQIGEHTGSKLHSEQEALFYQYSNVLRALARHFPLILFLDDLQWADTGSLSLLFSLGRSIANARILIVGAYRDEEIQAEPSGARHPLAAILNEFHLLYPNLVINLDEVEDHSFVDALLDSQPNRLGDAFRKMLFHQTRSHPLYTLELLRGMQERGDLVRNQDGEWAEGSAIHWDILPGKVEAAIAERIERLPQELRDYLQIGSVEGEGFTVEIIAEVQGSNPRTVLKELSEVLDRRCQLVRAEGLVRIGGKRLSRYRFRHILFQKYLYSRLDRVMLAHLHEQVGNALERYYGEQSGEVAGQLARHFEQAELIEKAVQYLSLAGERAESRAANQEAVAYFTRALELTPETDLQGRFELLLKRWKIYNHTSQTGLEVDDVRALERLAEDLGPAWQARAAICHLHQSIDVFRDEQGKQLQAGLVRSAIAWAREADQPSIEAEACKFQANQNYADPELIMSAYERGLLLARQAGLKGLEADIYLDMAVNRFIADCQTRIGFGEQALRLYRAVNDRYGESIALGMVAVNYRWYGDYGRALNYFEQSRYTCHEVGNQLYEMWSLLGVALSHYDSGRPQGQSGTLVEALEIVRATHVSWLEIHYLFHISELFLSEGDAVQSLAYAEQARQFYARSGLEKRSISEVMGLYRMGHALLELARLEEAAQAFRQCIEIAETSQHRDLFVVSLAEWADPARFGLAAVSLRQGNTSLALEHIEILWGKITDYDYSDGWFNLVFYQVFQANADPRASQVLGNAHRVLLERAARISDDGMRRSFLENIPENREIMALGNRQASSQE